MQNGHPGRHAALWATRLPRSLAKAAPGRCPPPRRYAKWCRRCRGLAPGRATPWIRLAAPAARAPADPPRTARPARPRPFQAGAATWVRAAAPERAAPPPARGPIQDAIEIGRAALRERVGQNV